MKKKHSKTKLELEAEASFQRMQDRWDRVPKFAGKFKVNAETVKVNAPVTLTKVERSPSTTKYVPGGCTKKDPPIYTGSNVLGVATLHKSNSVPVFSQQEAIEIATMRRN